MDGLGYQSDMEFASNHIPLFKSKDSLLLSEVFRKLPAIRFLVDGTLRVLSYPKLRLHPTWES